MLDLFSGIGGFHLAAEWCWGDELECVGHVEIDKFCQKVLKKHWSDVPIYDDVKTFKYDGEVDLITGGFPCQDISIAGKGEGIEGKRSGLWTEFKRIISECRPKFALIENVPNLIHRGLDRVLCDLAEIGYSCEWQSISASEVGAWHKRERIWIVAYPNSERLQGSEHDTIHTKAQKRQTDLLYARFFNQGYNNISRPEDLRNANGLSVEAHRLKSLGNAIVPQVAFIIMQQIKEVMDNDKSRSVI